MGGEIRWPEGQIWWAYQLAASVREVQITIPRTGTSGPKTARAAVVTHDPFRIRQRPLVFAVPHAHGVWRWPITELSLADGRVIARLGPPLE